MENNLIYRKKRYHFGQNDLMIGYFLFLVDSSFLNLTSDSDIFYSQFGVLLGVAASSRGGSSYGELNRGVQDNHFENSL